MGESCTNRMIGVRHAVYIKVNCHLFSPLPFSLPRIEYSRTWFIPKFYIWSITILQFTGTKLSVFPHRTRQKRGLPEVGRSLYWQAASMWNGQDRCNTISPYLMLVNNLADCLCHGCFINAGKLPRFRISYKGCTFSCSLDR